MDTIVNNKAFVLVEIILSVVLLSIVGAALFKVSSSPKKIYTIANKKVEFSRYVSILVNRHSSDLYNKDINETNGIHILIDDIRVSDKKYIFTDKMIKKCQSFTVNISKDNKHILIYLHAKDKNPIIFEILNKQINRKLAKKIG
jgi:hypothetical protein